MPQYDREPPLRLCGYHTQFCYREAGCVFSGQARDMDEYEDRLEAAPTCDDGAMETEHGWTRRGSVWETGGASPAPTKVPVR